MAQPSSPALVVHVVNRLSLGIAPGDVQRVTQMGVDRYIAEQLAPEQLPLPSGLVRQLEGLGTLKLSQKELIQQFHETQKEVRSNQAKGMPVQREFFQTLAAESGQARLMRSLHSPRQLEEVMVDFWFNHFNVFQGKGMTRALVVNYEQEAIRPHAMGRFRDLLGATAHHPAMLFYLDNWLSAAPHTELRKKAPGGAKAKGLNENYAREVMELHTLGVDGAYTQADVTQLARMLTGWTINDQRGAGRSAFYFDAARHDRGTKQWLGHSVSHQGQAEGEHALDVLAASPDTARHISFKLAQYFVADVPPPALVARLSQRFQATQGDIRAVLQTLFDSAEFRDPKVYGVKFKSPYRYVLSVVRAAGEPVGPVRPLLNALTQMGMPLYGCLTPDGYKNTQDAWLNPDAMTSRVDFAVSFASGQFPKGPSEVAFEEPVGKIKVNPDPQLQPQAVPVLNSKGRMKPVDGVRLQQTLGGSVSPRLKEALQATDASLRSALVLGSPDFMHY
ncbi:DUF1800 domain-containing protein [Limnohabitans sp.]|uniref:DUF1800 domain-containing protein n=1 Tax=Limnohabitans sp. TaxID=1907725 RepID=UPI0039BC3F2A|nr:DUF1800 domain-containing protein [Comamonadaceae bacterium]